MIGIHSSGSFKKSLSFLNYVGSDKPFNDLHRYGRQGVDALRSATPFDSGLTAESWTYRIIRGRKKRYHIKWYNTNVVDGVHVAILLQYGHATRNGGYVEGHDYINPALKPIFHSLSEHVWKKVTDA